MLRSPNAEIWHGRFFVHGKAFSLDYGLSMGDLFAITLNYLAQPFDVPAFVEKLVNSISIDLCRFDAYITSFILPIMCQQRPDCSCHFVGQHHIRRPAFAKLLNPCAWFLCVRQYRSRTMDQ